MIGRHDSYNAAVECDSGCHGDGITNERGVRQRLSDSGRRQAREGGGSRRGSIKRQAAVGLSAVHEEDTPSQTDQGAEPVAMATTNHSGGVVTRITNTSAQSTV